MANQLISPNFHVVLIHYPLGLLIAGTFIELFSFLWSRSSVRVAARWMILLAALSAIPATFSGIYALQDIAHRNNPAGDVSWVEVKAASPVLSQPGVWDMLRQHAIFQSLATGLSVLAVVIWLACSDRARELVRAPLILMLLGSLGLMVFGAYLGGEAIYRHAVGVEQISSEPKADTADVSLAKLIPILEIHVIAAGLVIAFAMGAIGMSIRKMTAKHEIIRDVADLPADQKAIGDNAMRTPASSMAMLRSFNPGIKLTVAPFAPAARFWLLTGVLAILTAGGGVFFLVQDSGAMAVAAKKHEPVVKVLWEQVKPSRGQTINRASAHIVAGVAIIVSSLLLATVIRYAPRQRFWMGLIVWVLLLAVGSQVWLGILLLYDTPDGSLTQFNAAAAKAPLP